jgi:hypothetical protein
MFRNLAFSKEHYTIVEILAKEPPSQVMKLVTHRKKYFDHSVLVRWVIVVTDQVCNIKRF